MMHVKNAVMLSLLLVIILLILTSKYICAIDLGEKLPASVVPEKIMWGQIMAYHPEMLYKKYGIEFFKTNHIIEKHETVAQNLTIKEYYYYFNDPSQLTVHEKAVLSGNIPQSFLKYKDGNGDNYLLLISGDHSGSSDTRDINVKLFKYEGELLQLVFNRTETYSIDPGLDSHYFMENFKRLVYKYIWGDKRYQ